MLVPSVEVYRQYNEHEKLIVWQFLSKINNELIPLGTYCQRGFNID